MSSDLTERLNQWKPLSKPEEDLYTSLPQEITRDILRRVSLGSIMKCKRVCKSWRDLIEGDEFMMSYTMKPCLVFSDRNMGYVVCDETHEPFFRFDVPSPRNESSCIISSANGFLLVRDTCNDILFTFDPITRDYVEIDPLHEQVRCIFGFGMSELSGQYKILYVNLDMLCFVYTHLGKGGGKWKRLSTPRWWKDYHITHFYDDNAVFVNGNLHWLASDAFKDPVLCCFELEFDFCIDISLPFEFGGIYRKLCVLGGQLCICHVTRCEDVVIWVMKDYEDGNSWVKEYTFTHRYKMHVCPLKILTSGDLVFTMPLEGWLFIYSKSTDTTLEHSILQRPYYNYNYYSSFVMYTPSLNLLKLHPVPTLAT